MKEFAWAGAAITAVFVLAAINRAVAWWRSVPSFSHLSYDLEPYPDGDPTDEDYERLWAQVDAALDARGDVQ